MQCVKFDPSLIFKTATLQYYHIDYQIFYSSYKYFCKQTPET